MTRPLSVWKGHFLSYFCSIHQGDSATAEWKTADDDIAILLLDLFVKLLTLVPCEIAWDVETAGNV